MSVDVKLGLFMRLFLWTYAIPASTENLNTCKLFWGFVFMPLSLPISVFIRAIVKIANPMFDYAARRRAAKNRSAAPRVRTGPSRGERALDFTSTRASMLWSRFQTLFKWAGIVIGLLLAVTLIVLAVVFYTITLKALLITAIVALSALLMFVALYALFAIFDSGLGSALASAGRGVHQKTCARVSIKR